MIWKGRVKQLADMVRAQSAPPPHYKHLNPFLGHGRRSQIMWSFRLAGSGLVRVAVIMAVGRRGSFSPCDAMLLM